MPRSQINTIFSSTRFYVFWNWPRPIKKRWWTGFDQQAAICIDCQITSTVYSCSPCQVSGYYGLCMRLCLAWISYAHVIYCETCYYPRALCYDASTKHKIMWNCWLQSLTLSGACYYFLLTHSGEQEYWGYFHLVYFFVY